MEQSNNYKKALTLSVIFVALVALILVGMVAAILATPYDSGILAGATLSGNNQYGGTLATSNDYLFYTLNGQILQYDEEEQQTKTIYQGTHPITHLNPFDGWLYFVEKGNVCRIAYYGGNPETLVADGSVSQMSVNGLWIYYCDHNGVISKIRTDGQKQSRLTDGSVKFTAFESANRIILATDGKDIYRMKTDGTDCNVLVTGTDITFMLYTLDDLYYADDGTVKRIKSVEAGQNDGTSYTEIVADLFNYNVDEENRGQIFYWKDGQLKVRKLQTIQHKTDEERPLATLTDVQDLYSVGADIYYHDKAGQLYLVRINDSEVSPPELVK
ncbi:MAG: DUF5050 domain-containing protein [Clostridia bacterium]|nr:DUF5050 domain-containing protein [Clostridia bacterium]